MIYVAKPQTWFKAGTEAELIEELYTDANGVKNGIFKGQYVVGSCSDDEPSEDDCSVTLYNQGKVTTPKSRGYDEFWYKLSYEKGDVVTMEEICSYSEFYECPDQAKADLAKLAIWLKSPEGRQAIREAQEGCSEVEKFINDAMKIDKDTLTIHFDI
jgi:hypothetical protein